MNEHVSQEQFAEAALSGVTPALQSHLNGCFTCRVELERLRRALGSLAEDAQSAAARPEGFWTRQQETIAARIQSGDFRAPSAQHWAGRLAWAGALAAVILAALLSLRPDPQRPALELTVVDPDEELLLGVEQSLRRPLPQALSPGVVLVTERNRAARLQQASARP